MKETLVGCAALGLPILLAGWPLMRGIRAALIPFLVLVAVGLGYLAATGAAGDIGAAILHLIGDRGSMKPGAVEAR
jgi:hypothetical protein